MLAQVFSITTDELLTGGEPKAQQAPPPSRRQGAGAWVCWLFRRWGWVGGLILAGYGAAMMGIGFIGKAAFRSMLPPMEIFTDGVAFGQPAFLITNFAIGIGGAVVLGGWLPPCALGASGIGDPAPGRGAPRASDGGCRPIALFWEGGDYGAKVGLGEGAAVGSGADSR